MSRLGMTASGTLVVLLLTFTAYAAGLDPRGWNKGTVAANASRVLAPVPQQTLNLPEAFVKELNRPALLVYFSPTCPHCQAVAPELAALEKKLSDKADVVMIASGASEQAEIDAFAAAYGFEGKFVHDQDREYITAMGVRSTPSAALVRKDKQKASLIDAWYPYYPGFDTLVEMRLADDPWSAFGPGEYHGNHTCGACHQQEMEAWTLTHHSIAWPTLVRGGEQRNDECNACHVTGKGAGGWSEDASREHLVNVGCEACHGPGGPHDGTPTEPRQTCETCHDAKHSIAFTYEKGVPHIDHFRTVGMDDDAYRQARMALIEGEVPRPALAFLEGKTLGAESCRTCHEAQYAQWKASPHAHAMGTLTGDKATKTECVRCHATQSDEEFLVAESVGCEACHGPGEKHVAAGGGTDNIEKLGDDCPVCVIEAVCTGCHTKKWDPNWDLESHLSRVGH